MKLPQDKPPKILFWDIETSPFQIWTFRIGNKMSAGHHQIVKGTSTDIICIAYSWDHEDQVHILDWGYDKQDSKEMIKKFDSVINQADIVIAQNGDRFDVRHINTQRLLHNLPPMPDWTKYTDDLLKQVKKFFYLPSYRLDYMSALFGCGGKQDMDFDDWINIVEKNTDGFASFEKMKHYCMKDVADLKEIWNKVKHHVKPRLNIATLNGGRCCTSCGSTDIHKNGTRVRSKTRYQNYHCKTHGGHAGSTPMSQILRIEGKMGN